MPVITIPETIAKVINPNISSITAAPKIIPASRVLFLLISLSTHAVILTLVAPKVAATNKLAFNDISGNKKVTPKAEEFVNDINKEDTK